MVCSVSLSVGYQLMLERGHSNNILGRGGSCLGICTKKRLAAGNTKSKSLSSSRGHGLRCYFFGTATELL